jgi:hypothetical protein
MQVGDKVTHLFMDCELTILEIREEVQVKCLVDCDETQTPTWYFLWDLKEKTA